MLGVCGRLTVVSEKELQDLEIEFSCMGLKIQ